MTFAKIIFVVVQMISSFCLTISNCTAGCPSMRKQKQKKNCFRNSPNHDFFNTLLNWPLFADGVSRNRLPKSVFRKRKKNIVLHSVTFITVRKLQVLILPFELFTFVEVKGKFDTKSLHSF